MQDTPTRLGCATRALSGTPKSGHNPIWIDAGDVMQETFKLYPDWHWPWYQIAALYLSIGDVERYRGVCREMLDRFEASGAKDPQVAEITAKTCSLAPDSVPDFTRVERLAEKCVTLDIIASQA